MALTFQSSQCSEARGILELSFGIPEAELPAKQDCQLGSPRRRPRTKPTLYLLEPCRLGESFLDCRASPSHTRGIPQRAAEVQKNLWGMRRASPNLSRGMRLKCLVW